MVHLCFNLENQKSQPRKPKKSTSILITCRRASSNSPRVHGKIKMKLKRLPRYCLIQKVDMLKRGWYVNDRYILHSYQFPEKMVPHIDMLGVGVSDGILRKLHCTLINYPRTPECTASLHQATKNANCLKNSATYSASLVESVTHF